MSTSAPVTPAPNPSQVAVPDKFTLHDEQRTMQVTYFPMGSGPIITGKTSPGPKLEYTGEEGNFTFSGNQIESVNCPVGNLLSVTLRPDADAGALIFTLALPNVTEPPESKSQRFQTIAVKTHTRGFVVGPGVDRTYNVLRLHGLAETVALPR